MAPSHDIYDGSAWWRDGSSELLMDRLDVPPHMPAQVCRPLADVLRNFLPEHDYASVSEIGQ